LCLSTGVREHFRELRFIFRAWLLCQLISIAELRILRGRES